MKINSELERLLATEQHRQQQSRTVGSSGGEGFESLLAQQLTQMTPAQSTTGADPERLRALADPLRLANLDVAMLGGLMEASETEIAGATEDKALLESLTGGLTATLGGFDTYAANLNSGSLKDAWGSLSVLDGSIAGLRQKMGQLSKPSAELDSMLNEIEVLAATEKFKFNRGDYLS